MTKSSAAGRAPAFVYVAAAVVLVVAALVAILLLRSRGRAALGMDVGNSQIKIVELRCRRGDCRIVRYAVHPTPRGSIENGIVRHPGELARAAKEAHVPGRFRVREGVTVLTGQNLMIRHARFPPMPESDVAAAVRWQFGEYFQLDQEHTLVDYQVLPSAEGPGSLSVMLVAMHKEPVLKFVDHLKEAGFTATGVDIEPLAVIRVARLCVPEVAAGSAAVVDIGAGTTNISIFKNCILQAARVLPIAGNDITRAIMAALGIDYREAEEVKVRVGLRTDSHVFTHVVPVRDGLFAEIGRTIGYYLAENRGETLKVVVVAGGNGALAGLVLQLETYLRETIPNLSPEFKVRLCNPLLHIDSSVPEERKHIVGPMLAVAVGLALGEVQRW